MLPSMLLPRFLSRFAAFVAAAIVFVTLPLRAQDAPDSGWFDPNETTAAPPADAAVVASDEKQSIPPSPLLAERNPSGAAPDPADADPRALQDFRPQLEPYGTWMQHPTYGTVWVPNPSTVGTNFAPYVSSGHWALTDDGDWIWVSDYAFGSIVFHYGRWVWVSGTGWAWIPGYRYAPAWVSWRVPTGSYAYVGWAPLGPDFIWYNGVAVSFWWGVSTPWCFVPSAYVFYPHVHYYVVRDRALLPRLAAHSRRYVPASPRTAGSESRAYTSAAPRAAGSFETRSRGPSLAAARVPANAVPRERLRAVPPFRPSPRTTTSRVESPTNFRAPRRVESLPGERRAGPVPRRVAPSSSPGVTPRPAPAPRSSPPERAESLRPTRPPPAIRPLPRPAPAPRLAPPSRGPRPGLAPAPHLPRRRP